VSLRESVLKIVRAAFPVLTYGYPRTFRVRGVGADGRLDLDPPPDTDELKPLDRVEQWTVGGALMAPALGSLVVVTFRDADPSRPIVMGLAPAAIGNASARKGDLAARLFFDTITATLYVSESVGAPYAWTAVATGIIPPTIADAGTAVTIAQGSATVRVSA
jgi:hypothetical protein